MKSVSILILFTRSINSHMCLCLMLLWMDVIYWILGAQKGNSCWIIIAKNLFIALKLGSKLIIYYSVSLKIMPGIRSLWFFQFVRCFLTHMLRGIPKRMSPCFKRYWQTKLWHFLGHPVAALLGVVPISSSSVTSMQKLVTLVPGQHYSVS